MSNLGPEPRPFSTLQVFNVRAMLATVILCLNFRIAETSRKLSFRKGQVLGEIIKVEDDDRYLPD